jgi:hypothetical protein
MSADLTPARPPNSRRPPAWLLAALFLLAALPRLVLALIYLDLPIGLDDMFQYDMLGRSLAAGHGYRWYSRADVAALRPYLDKWYKIDLPTAQVPVDGYQTTFRAPGYPALLAAIYLAVGTTYRLQVVRLLQALLGAALAPLTALLASRLRLPGPSAIAAGVAVGLYPILWMYPLGLGSENVFFLLSLAAGLALLAAASSGRPWKAASAGLLPSSRAVRSSSPCPSLACGWRVVPAGAAPPSPPGFPSPWSRRGACATASSWDGRLSSRRRWATTCSSATIPRATGDSSRGLH